MDDVTTKDVSDAVALLARRLEEARQEVDSKSDILLKRNDEIRVLTAEIADLEAEMKRIMGALSVLQASAPGLAPSPLRATVREEAPRVSVRAYVLELLQGAYQFWTSAELVATVERDISSGHVNIQVRNVASSVRSAIWNLMNDGEIRRGADERVVATHWVRDSIPTLPTDPDPGEEEARAS